LSPHFQDGPFELKNFQNYGNNNLHEFVWATWFYRFPHVKGYPASSSPQLYILIHSNGLKFGLDYGNDVEEDNPLVTQVFSDNDLIQSIIAACKVVPSYSLVEGGPYLAQRSDEVRLSSADEVRKNWSNRVHLIKQFLLDEIPDNIEDIIDETLEKLVPLFKKLCNKEVTRFEEEEPVGLVEDYSKEDFYREVFFHESLLEDILEILNRKKNIVLQGAPGTGKSFISERIAYLYMGKKDKSRVRTIQFHQSYS
jgi:hypothetical protein